MSHRKNIQTSNVLDMIWRCGTYLIIVKLCFANLLQVPVFREGYVTSKISANVSLNLLNLLQKSNKMPGKPPILFG